MHLQQWHLFSPVRTLMHKRAVQLQAILRVGGLPRRGRVYTKAQYGIYGMPPPESWNAAGRRVCGQTKRVPSRRHHTAIHHARNTMEGGVLDERLLAPAATSQFLWIVIVASFGAIFAAFGIGANDLANAFATSVGAKALTIKQAVVLAGVFEFLGAVFLGSHVTKTIRKGVADVRLFRGWLCSQSKRRLW
ncbi:unnamed protein product [Ectocarpus fasciculatus]